MKIAATQQPNERQNSTSDSRRFVLNVGSNLLMLVLNVITGLWLTSYLVGELGVSLYGMVALATSVTLYMSVISTALSNGVGRYLTIDIKQSRIEDANRTFNTALWGSLGLCALTLPGVALIAFFAPQIFNVPPGYEQASRWLFACVMGAYLISIVRSIFTVSTFVHSRFDLQNLVLATNLITRVVLVVALFSITAPSLVSVGIATLVATLASFAVAWPIWRRLTPELSLAPQTFDRTHLRTLSSTSGWFFVNQAGSLLFLNIDLLVVNIILGPEAGGRYGIVLQWTLLLRTLATTVSSVLTPTILAQYARSDMTAITRTAQQSVKLLGLAMALPIGLICGLAPVLLQIWLGPEFTDLWLLMVVQVAHLSLNLMMMPLLYVQIAMNKIRLPAIVTLCMGFVNLLLALAWSGFGTHGLGVAIAGAVVLSLKNGLFTPIYGSIIQELPWSTYFRTTMKPLLATLAIAGIAGSISLLAPPQNWFSLALVVTLITLPYIAISYWFGLNAAERNALRKFTPGQQHKQ